MTLKAGYIYLTTYGVAVIIKVQENEVGEVESFRAKLWRQPGKSVATSASATLLTNCVRLIDVPLNYLQRNQFLFKHSHFYCTMTLILRTLMYL